MLNISRTMLIQYLTVVMAALALPQLVAVIPESAMPWLALVSGALTLFVRWYEGQTDAISVFAGLTFLAGVLSLPEFFAVIPPQWAQIVTLITGVLNLITRANQATTPLKSVLGVPLIKQ